MKYLSRAGKIFTTLILSFIGILFIASIIMQERVSAIILSSLNKSLSVKVEAKSVRFSFLRKFPKASIQLKNALVHSSEGFNTLSAESERRDTLLFAGSLFIKLNPVKVIRGIYTIDELSLNDGVVYLLTDSTGKINYKLTREGTPSKGDRVIELNTIRLRNMHSEYTDFRNRLSYKGNIEEGRIRTKIKGSFVQLSANSKLRIDKLSVSDTEFRGPFNSDILLDLQSAGNKVTFKQSSITLDGVSLAFSGSFSGKSTDLQFAAEKADIGKLTGYLPGDYSGKLSGYDFSGELDFSGNLKGGFGKDTMPHIQIKYALSDGSIKHLEDAPTVNDISFNGNFTNGLHNAGQTSSLTLDDIRLKLGSTQVNGTMMISDFREPVTTLSLKGRIFPEDLRRFFAMTVINHSEGSIDADLKLVTGAPAILLNPDTLVYLKPEGSIKFNAFTFGWGEDGRVIRNMTGDANISDVYRTPEIKLEYASQKINIAGEFRNFTEWLAGKPFILTGNFIVSFDRFIPEAFMSEDEAGAATEFPKDIIAGVSFRADSLSYKSFRSSDVSGNLDYKPGRITVNNFTLNSLSGRISGKGYIQQNNDMTFTSKGEYEITGIDVNKTFRSFGNFGQDFIKAENLSGKLSGSVSLLLPFGNDFSPKTSSAVAEGRFILDNGSLINFEPVKELSDFIELSELENIHFQKLENDFNIRDNAFYLPQMDVKSSAADIAVNGRHDFNNNYEYHVRVLLSQILSRKRKEKRQPVTEFGAVQDDGLGRTSLLLKVENRGDDVKVSYDVKAVGEQVKNNIRNEKQTLKTILNEEYGWYKNEVSAGTPVQKKSRVSIVWSENDSITGQKEYGPEDAGNDKNIFRKR
jgi:hypothetical protein